MTQHHCIRFWTNPLQDSKFSYPLLVQNQHELKFPKYIKSNLISKVSTFKQMSIHKKGTNELYFLLILNLFCTMSFNAGVVFTLGFDFII